MNERIKQLREQSRTLVSNEERDRGELYEAREQWERCDQKFAELIVRDCIRTLRSNGYDDAAQCLQDIHFGIADPI